MKQDTILLIIITNVDEYPKIKRISNENGIYLERSRVIQVVIAAVVIPLADAIASVETTIVMTSEAGFVGATTTLPPMNHEWLTFPADFSSFGAPFPGGYNFESKAAFSAFPPLESQQAVPVNVNRAEVDSTGDSKGPPTPASAASGTSQSDDRADSSPTSNGNAGYRPWEQVAESYTEEKSPPTKTAVNATSSTEAFHNGSTPSDDSTSSTQASAEQRPPSAFKASSQTPSPFGSDGNFRSATAEADTTTTELRPVVADFQVAAVTSSTPLSRPPSQMHSLAALEPLQPLQPLQALPPQLQVPVSMTIQGQNWSQELASPQAVPIQLGQLPGQHLLLQHPQQHSPVHNLNQPGQIPPIGRQPPTPPTPTQMVQPSSSPGATEVSGSNERQQQKKKRKRCGECPGCLKKDNCGECGPCRSVRSHQICKMRRCDTLVKTKKDKAPAQPRQKKTDGTKAKGNAKNARANGQDAPMGTSASPEENGNPAKRHRASPDENKNLHQLNPEIKPQFSLIGAAPNGMYIHQDPSMPPPHVSDSLIPHFHGSMASIYGATDVIPQFSPND
ncbi:uncharacterized protein LOC100898320 [Galendromus occidentalis]|uniref:Uncharacterized protein LOC100898320 n=1 Tax=Galendromus occidentalis TaxID=34638 RepID=A0AAJ7SEW1_9ACAR|nr:uncharacterized protein LOC100898320 [Galendromus occidentalis]